MSISDVADQLAELQKALNSMKDVRNGRHRISHFNLLYLEITRCVEERRRARAFLDPFFLNRLAVEFAEFYTGALRQWCAADAALPAAWSALFLHGDDDRLRPLMCTAAGVNAHINYDLPYALLATWRHCGVTTHDSPQHRDYLQVDQVFRGTAPHLRRRLTIPGRSPVARFGGHLFDHGQLCLVELARAQAWRQGHSLWRAQSDPVEIQRKRSILDRRTAAVSRALLSPSMNERP